MKDGSRKGKGFFLRLILVVSSLISLLYFIDFIFSNSFFYTKILHNFLVDIQIIQIFVLPGYSIFCIVKRYDYFFVYYLYLICTSLWLYMLYDDIVVNRAF
jgi:hypothetical protein